MGTAADRPTSESADVSASSWLPVTEGFSWRYGFPGRQQVKPGEANSGKVGSHRLASTRNLPDQYHFGLQRGIFDDLYLVQALQ